MLALPAVPGDEKLDLKIKSVIINIQEIHLYLRQGVAIMHAQLSSYEKDAISLFKGKLEKRCGDNLMKLLLFGSRARGEGSSTSDIDLLVLLREESFRAQKEILDDAAEIVLEQGINLSPCVMGIKSLERLRGLERLFARDIDREGIAL